MAHRWQLDRYVDGKLTILDTFVAESLAEAAVHLRAEWSLWPVEVCEVGGTFRDTSGDEWYLQRLP